MATDQDALYGALSPRAQKCWNGCSPLMIGEFRDIAEEEGLEFAIGFVEEWAEYTARE